MDDDNDERDNDNDERDLNDLLSVDMSDIRQRLIDLHSIPTLSHLLTPVIGIPESPRVNILTRLDRRPQ